MNKDLRFPSVCNSASLWLFISCWAKRPFSYLFLPPPLCSAKEVKMNIADKLTLIRKASNMTQAGFAEAIGISRSNLANIELGKVKPTKMFINCVSLMFNIDKEWLTDGSNDDLSMLNNAKDMSSTITKKYERLNTKYKKFVENQMNQLLEIQENK